MQLTAKDGKIIDFGVEGTKFFIAVDPNDDGQALLKLEIDMLEIPDELASLFTNK